MRNPIGKRRANAARRAPQVIERHFGWLEDRGFGLLASADDWGAQATYGKDDVLVYVSYERRDSYADVSVARRRGAAVDEVPYWAHVHLDELLALRAPAEGRWLALLKAGADESRSFALGAELLRTHCGDLLEGRNLEVLDEIIAKRPRAGVPGLDYPAEEPWAASAEGVWFTTDSERPLSMATYLERSRSEDSKARAVAALKIPIAARVSRDVADRTAGQARLRELLADAEADVRRAAASALGELGDAESLGALLTLLDAEPGDRSSPVAAAVTFLAIDLGRPDKERVLEALQRFAARGAPAAQQVAQLEWRLADGPPAYPRYVGLWRPPSDDPAP